MAYSAPLSSNPSPRQALAADARSLNAELEVI